LSGGHAFRAHSSTPRGRLRVRHGQWQYAGPDAEAGYSDSKPGTCSSAVTQVHGRTHRHAAELFLSCAQQIYRRPLQDPLQTYAHAYGTDAASHVPLRHQAAGLLTHR
jgi:hypothetical protein